MFGFFGCHSMELLYVRILTVFVQHKSFLLKDVVHSLNNICKCSYNSFLFLFLLIVTFQYEHLTFYWRNTIGERMKVNFYRAFSLNSVIKTLFSTADKEKKCAVHDKKQNSSLLWLILYSSF